MTTSFRMRRSSRSWSVTVGNIGSGDYFALHTREMKVRIGVGVSGSALPAGGLGVLVDELDALGFDSLWLSEVLTTPVMDPLVGLAWAAARSPTLKLGTTMLLPGRNPLRLAKALASLD